MSSPPDTMQPSDDDSNAESTDTSLPQPPQGDTQVRLGGGVIMENNPNDEAYQVTDDQEMQTPPRFSNGDSSAAGPGGARSDAAVVPGSRLMSNNPNDEMVLVDGADVVDTPTKMDVRTGAPIQPETEDTQEYRPQQFTPKPDSVGRTMSPGNSEGDDDDENEEEEDNDYGGHGYAGQKPEAMTNMNPEPAIVTNLEYNPNEYAKVNAKASREIQDLFRHILDFRPFVAELPTKLRPFIPDYIPAIGDLDPFVKVPRPDGRSDGLGLYVVDEPAIPQSNPAVVQLELRATNVHGGEGATVVDSFEDAANRPEVIDRWIADLKKVHYKKALPTVNYQKPMPDIENLMQVWPQPFEDLLNSDLQFPPSHIDLDMDQYVRTLCAILDIPTYQSLIDPLHVMFTLYEDFRSNQHFQHE